MYSDFNVQVAHSLCLFIYDFFHTGLYLLFEFLCLTGGGNSLRGDMWRKIVQQLV